MIILRAEGGEVSWGGYVNGQAGMGTNLGHRSSTTEFVVGFGGTAILPPGKYKLGSLSAGILSGSPAIDFAPASGGFPGDFTGFGSECPGTEQDFTLKLGLDWSDADGLGAPMQMSLRLDLDGEGVGQSETVTISSCYPASWQEFCVFTVRPSRLNAPEPYNRCCKDFDAPEFYGCTITITCNGSPASSIPVRLEMHPKQLTGGHCHANGLRPTTSPAQVDGVTDDTGKFRFVLQMPEVSGVLNMVVYSTDSQCGFNTARDTLYTMCVKIPELVALPPGEGYTISSGGEDNLTRHPWFHYGTQGTIDALKAMAKEVQAAVPEAVPLLINDMSLEWGGRFDIIPRESTCDNHTHYYDDDWRAPHCGHALGMTVDIQVSNQPNQAKRALKWYFESAKRHPTDPSFTRRSRFAPGWHGNQDGTRGHWHCELQ
jgi:hypothetical protein